MKAAVALVVAALASATSHARVPLQVDGTLVTEIDGKGRIVVAVARAGRVEHAFLLQGAAASDRERVARPGRFDGSVEFDGKTLVVATRTGATFRLGVADPVDRDATYVGGVELVHVDCTADRASPACGGDRGLEGIVTDSLPSVTDGACSLEPVTGERSADPKVSAPELESCQSGGFESKSCGVRCTNWFGTIRTSCTVECKEGYYACCSCDEGCRCIMKFPQLWPYFPVFPWSRG